MTRAARRLHLAQPALSQAISGLESKLGVRLFARNPRGVTLTAAGEAFLPKARAVLHADEEAVMTARSFARATDGVLDLGFIGFPPVAHSNNLLAAFRSAFPQVHIRFRELSLPSSETLSWLAEVDLALCHSPPVDSQISAIVVHRERRAVLAAVHHPLAAHGSLTAEEVVCERFIGLHPEVHAAWRAFWQLDDCRGGPARTSRDRVLSGAELMAAATAGHGIAAAPLSQAAAAANSTGGLRSLPIPDAPSTELALMWREDHLNPLVAAFVATASHCSSYNCAG